jgi:predicted small secreted protein
MIKKYICLAMLVCLSAFATACNTAEGFGEDMEKAGEKIQKETK